MPAATDIDIDDHLAPDDTIEKVKVTVHNEDDGDEYHLHARISSTLAKAIARLYKDKLRRERREDDRLTCEAGGEDVFQYEDLTFEAYLADGHCPGLQWLFVAGTGGA
jgi:hypothetical protein